MKSHRRLAVIGAIAGSALAAAQPPVETQLRYEIRRYDPANNLGWVNAIQFAVPGDRFEVRAVVSYIGTSSVHGLGQIIFQPIITNWTAGDSLITQDIDGAGPSTLQGIGPMGSNTSSPPGYVNDQPGSYGRISPFAGANTTTSTFYRGHVHVNPDGSGGTYLRIARNDVTNWLGVGPSSGAGAVNNTNGGGGITVAQGTIGAGRPTTFPPQNNNLQNIVVFKFSFQLSAATADRPIMQISTPSSGIGRSTAASSYGQPDTRWYSAADQTSPGLYRSDVEVIPATLFVVPSPSGALVLAGASCLARRRRR